MSFKKSKSLLIAIRCSSTHSYFENVDTVNISKKNIAYDISTLF